MASEIRRLRQRIASMGLLALGSLASVVGPAVGVEADLGDRGDVDHVVHPPVPGPGEPVPVLLTGGGVQGCGAGPGREPVAVGEPGDVADVGQDPGGARRVRRRGGPSGVSRGRGPWP